MSDPQSPDRADVAVSADVVLEVARSSEAVEISLPLQITGGRARRRRVRGPARPCRAVPSPRPARPFTRDSTLEELRQTRRGRVVAAGLQRVIRGQVDAEAAAAGEGTAMIERSLRQLPLRAFSAFSGGRLSWRIVDTLLLAVNGRPRLRRR